VVGNKVSGATGNTLGATLISNAASRLAGVVAGGALGGTSGATNGAGGALNADLYNRQLHSDERQWAKDNAKQFAEFYKEKTGQDLTSAQAENMLLANGYRLVDAAASKGPGVSTRVGRREGRK
jgi:filamentous hemagglutinin